MALGVLGGHHVDHVFATWYPDDRKTNLLVVVDVSGSMDLPAAAGSKASRIELVRQGCRSIGTLLPNESRMGLWEFGSQLDGTKDYKELVPIGPVAANRGQLVAALDGMKPKENGDTGMYDSILAAYQALQSGWTEGMVNTLILLTDGENDDKNGLNREQLLGELGKVKDQKRPIRVLIITIGPDVSPTNLKPITDLTGGGVFAAPDPAKIGEIFLQAITTRT